MIGMGAGLAIVACRTSLYLLRKSYGPAAMPGCGAKGGCDAVLSSRWAKVGKFPVAGVGALLYLLLSAGLVLMWAGALEARGARAAVLGLGLVAGFGAAWFIGVQLVLI